MSAIHVRAGARDLLADPAVHRELAGRYFLFDAFVGGRRRVDVQPLFLPRELHEQAVQTAEAAVRVLGGAVAGRALNDPRERNLYGLSPDVVRLADASHRAGDAACLARIDLLLGADLRWKVCEVNADCPGGHNETLGLPELARAAGFRDGANPTRVVERAVARLAELARRPGEAPGAVALVYATAYAEDLQVCALLRRALQRAGVEALLTAPTALRLRGGDLSVAGRRVSALYRFFPTEYMEGLPNLGEIEEAVATGRLRTLSSFSQMYLQSKLVMARAWALRGELSPADAAFVEAHVPETRLLAEVPKEALLGERAGWVIKRALGRVGDEVFVGPLMDEGWEPLVEHTLTREVAGERWLAQRFVEQRPVPTPWGDRLVTLGAYVLDGRFAGYFARLTPDSHVSHDALVVPVFTEVPA